MSSRRIEIGARPIDDPRAKAWIQNRAEAGRQQDGRQTARMTLDVTPALRTRIKLAAIERGVTMAQMLREVLEREFPEVSS
ncbi:MULTISPECIES: ribbon-helix-helix protein [Pseudomonas]|uniref:Chromosome partitioning protein ParB n=1 Tax=Pseudomonas fulva (strain 12-X) TaxID=743720 RepID=F6AAR4_PSEF1|nr:MULTISPECIES: hypothetical protein [Pseudomonas]AEF22117.1 hypothetical protein Psefu_2146 [Pseudomonas fulva 12-X]PZW71287.1 hypothetical protein F471_00356 [Pseudomonas sp. URMO17WK12:I1]